ncbi:MAG: beta-galactosidase trimerization domain-containing protein [Tepidisphaeraceae bacterium]
MTSCIWKAQALATYASEFYAGSPAVTRNSVGRGEAYYLATRFKDDFHLAFYASLVEKLKITRALDVKLPAGVTAQTRTDGAKEFVFFLNFTREAHQLSSSKAHGSAMGFGAMKDAFTNDPIGNKIDLPAYSARVLVREVNP